MHKTTLPRLDANIENDVNYIDPWRDGVQNTYIKLLGKAYDGLVPEGVFDIDPSAGLGRTMNRDSDLHVEQLLDEEAMRKAQEDMDFINYDLDCTPLTYAEEPVPSETKVPFVFPEGEATAPGLLGSAIRAYGQSVVMMSEYGNDVKEYEGWFTNAWSIPLEYRENLKNSKPILRSTGAARWGGFNKNTKPACFAYPSAQANIKVVFHGKDRTKYGENSLVNWPKINAMARIIATQLYVDDKIIDNYYKGAKPRLDFYIIPYEIPHAPTTVRINILKSQLKFVESRDLSTMARSVFNFINKAVERQSKHIKERVGNLITFEVPDMVPDYVPVNMRVSKYSGFMTYDNIMAGMDDRIHDYQDILEKQKKVQFYSSPNKNVSYRTVLNELAYGGVTKHINTLPRAGEIYDWIEDMDLTEQYLTAKFALVGVVKLVYTVNLFDLLTVIGNMLGPNIGHDWLIKLFTEWNIPQSFFKDLKKSALYDRCLNEVEPLVDLAKMAAYHIRAAEHEIKPTFSRKLITQMMNSHDVVLGLQIFFEKRIKFWTNRYKRNAIKLLGYVKKGDKSMEEVRRDIAANQMYSKMLKHCKFHVQADGVITTSIPNFNALITESANHYIRKRAKYEATQADFYQQIVTDAKIASGDLDVDVYTQCGMMTDPEFKEVKFLVSQKAAEIALDIHDFLNDIFSSNKAVNEEDYEEVILTEEELKEFDDPCVLGAIKKEKIIVPPILIDVKKDLEIPKQIEKPTVTQAASRRRGAVQVMAKIANDDEVALCNMKVDNRLVIASNIFDFCPGIAKDDIQELVYQFGEKVDTADWEKVLESARNLAALRLQNAYEISKYKKGIKELDSEEADFV